MSDFTKTIRAKISLSLELFLPRKEAEKTVGFLVNIDFQRLYGIGYPFEKIGLSRIEVRIWTTQVNGK
jgi:hypothetical protein